MLFINIEHYSIVILKESNHWVEQEQYSCIRAVLNPNNWFIQCAVDKVVKFVVFIIDFV